MTKRSYEKTSEMLSEHVKELTEWLEDRYATPPDALMLLMATSGPIVALILGQPEKAEELAEELAEAMMEVIKKHKTEK